MEAQITIISTMKNIRESRTSNIRTEQPKCEGHRPMYSYGRTKTGNREFFSFHQNVRILQEK